MIIMGIDPGLSSTGVGIIEETPKQEWKALFWEHVTSSPSMQLPSRLERINDLVVKAIDEYNPDVAAIESIFFARNVRSAVMMAHGRGAAILAAARTGVEIVEYSPLEIKQSVVGKGRAGKEQVRQMVTAILRLEKPPRSDHESDALACALCHGMRFRTVAMRQQKLAASITEESDSKFDQRKSLLAQSFKRSGKRRR